MKSFKAILACLCLCLVAIQVKAELVVIVSHKNPVNTINQEALSKIFLGKLKLFPDGSSAIPLDLPEKDEDKRQFYQLTTGKSESQLKMYWAKVIFTGAGIPTTSVDSPAEMLKLVAENPNTIGYIDKRLVDDTVKVVWNAP